MTGWSPGVERGLRTGWFDALRESPPGGRAPPLLLGLKPLLYFVTETFDPAKPDELRIPWDHPAVKALWDVPNG